ncbi:MAG: hypothetical protein ACKO3W_09330 [bacterium]
MKRRFYRFPAMFLTAAACMAPVRELTAQESAPPMTSAEVSASPTLSRAPRGATGSFELTSDAPIRAKATSDLTAPVLVRVAEIAPKRFLVEYMGLVTGTYDLAPYLEQTDGRAAVLATPIRVEVFTQLPPNHGTDVFGRSEPSFGIRAHYREILVAAATAWVLIPMIVIGVRLARRRPAPAPAPLPRAPTLDERLFTIVDEARSRDLSTDELGKLELLLLRMLREHVRENARVSVERDPSDSPAALAVATEALRSDPTHGPVVRAVERWLHARDEGDARDALAAIDQLRARRAPAMEGAR